MNDHTLIAFLLTGRSAIIIYRRQSAIVDNTDQDASAREIEHEQLTLQPSRDASIAINRINTRVIEHNFIFLKCTFHFDSDLTAGKAGQVRGEDISWA